MKVNLTDLANLQNELTAVTAINANSTLIEGAVDNTLSRDGTSPNQMMANLDMNTNRILNLPAPGIPTEPLRLQDLIDFEGGGITVLTQASQIQSTPFSTISATNVQAALQEIVAESTAVTSFLDSTFDIKDSGDITKKVNFEVSGVTTGTTRTMTIPNENTTLVGTAATQTLTNKSIDSGQLTGTIATARLPAFGSGDVSFAAAGGAGTIANNTVTNAKLAQAGAATLKGNVTAGTANETDFTIQGLTNLATPSSTLDFLPIYDHVAGTIKNCTPGAIVGSTVAGVSSFNTLTGAVTSNINHQVFTATGTYTPTSGMLHCIVECVGGGGGGGGSAGTASDIFIAGGGGGGAYSRVKLTAAQIGASKAVTIGAGGTGGVAAANGGVGGTTSLGSLCVAVGGTGGVFSSVAQIGNGGTGGLGSGGTGDLSSDGTSGGGGYYSTTATILVGVGHGGSSFFNGGAAPAVNGTNVNGNAGGRYGGGGSGALTNNTTNTATGGAGGAGVVIVTEYINL